LTDVSDARTAAGLSTRPVVVAPHQPLVELGRGGVGVVHLARRTRDQELVVIKRLRPDFARNVQVRRMFLEEARIASLIEHPNVVAVTDSGFDETGAPWIEMPWSPGVSLQTAIDADALQLPQFLWILCELLNGLEYAHSLLDAEGRSLEIVHRDVSPHNVLLTSSGNVKLLDFGIAKIRDARVDTTTGVIKGKITYMAPEQATQREVDRRVDVFAVGVILYQRLAGKRLWDGVLDRLLPPKRRFAKLRIERLQVTRLRASRLPVHCAKRYWQRRLNCALRLV
jgi:eukaryotic-like serine/threonine-protein kinase